MTRSILIFLGICFISQISADGSGDLRPFLNRFKNVMKTGNESLGIPVYDPCDRKEETFHVKISYVSVDLFLKNLHMTGLSEYQVKHGRYAKAGLAIELALRWEKIVTETEYDINGTVVDKYQVYGKGNLTGIIRGLDVTCTVDISLGSNGLEVEKISSTVHLESLDFKATGLMNDEKRSEVLSKLISQHAPQIIRNNPKQAGQIMSDVTEKKVNEIIADLTVKDLLDLIKE